MAKKLLAYTLILCLPVVLLLTGKAVRKDRAPDFRDAPASASDTLAAGFGLSSLDGVFVPEASKAEDVSPEIERVAIFGTNTITDYYKVDSSLRQLADSTVALVDKSALHYDHAAGKYTVTRLRPLGAERHFEDGTDFNDQKALSFCSGALVARDIVLTAGHCAPKDPADQHIYFGNVYAVFGWKSDEAGKFPESFDARDVYTVSRVYIRKLAELNATRAEDLLNNYEDYALLILEKPAQGRRPLTIDRSGLLVNPNADVFTIGYPMGMSVKITAPLDGRIHAVGKNLLATDIDAFGGNSGGPVFDSSTRRIIGVLVTADARDRLITLKSPLVIPFTVTDDENAQVDVVETTDAAGRPVKSLAIRRDIYEALSTLPHTRHIFTGPAAITMETGARFYNNSIDFRFMSLVGFQDFKAQPAKFEKVTELLRATGVQRVVSVIDQLVPLTYEEKAACQKLRQGMNNNGVINPDLMLIYRASKCGREMSV
jgi:V8-like Glu-specific endopeptidase